MPGHILISENVVSNRIILRARLTAAAYDVTQSQTGAATLAIARDKTPDLILLSADLPDMPAAEICRHLQANPATRNIPVIVMSAMIARPTRLALLSAGAEAVMARLPDDPLLLARIRNLMRRSTAERELARDGSGADPLALAEPHKPDLDQPGRIAIIAPTTTQGKAWRAALADKMRDRISVLDPVQALVELGREAPPDAVIVADHADQPGSAVHLVSELRCRSETFRAALIVVQGEPDGDQAAMALNLGVNAVVEHGFDAAELALHLRRELARKARDDHHRAALKNGLRLAALDPLTGLYNRRFAMGQLEAITRVAAERNEQFAVLVLDLDRFKRINDQFGHVAGDAVLKTVSQRMSGVLRRNDFLARIGGEEFLVVLRNSSPVIAERTAERLRRCISDRDITLPGNQNSVRMTISIGLVAGGRVETPTTPEKLIEIADRGLYSSKSEGRNQVTVSRTAA